MKKFKVNGFETPVYAMSNKEILDLSRDESLSSEDREYLRDKIIQRFEYSSVPRKGETMDDVFARRFSDFVNGECLYWEKVVEKMAKDHRTLQTEMYSICRAFIMKMAENEEKGLYDPRNEWACKDAKKIKDFLLNNH